MRRLLLSLLPLALLGCGGGNDLAKDEPLPAESARLFAFDREATFDSSEGQTAKQKGFVVKGMSYASPGGDRVTGIVVVPTKRIEGRAGVVFMHGAGGTRIDFIDEAAVLAARGAVVLAIDSPFSRSPRPEVRAGQAAPALTRKLMIRNVKDLVRGFDLLVRRYGVSPERLGIVGYSMGVQPAALAASLDARVRAVVLMAGRANPSGTPGDVEWELLFGPIDTVHFVSHLAPANVLLQGGKGDEVIPREEMEQLYAATSKPKEIRWYDAGHELGERSKDERLAWLGRELGLK
ncbi:MAG: alpha/beta fold hydrolase [Actinobacteria bacterium]|nr:alpha/beta fold hydrolase [Actinomycetota bacterium]